MGSSLATARGMRRAALAWTALCVVLGILVALSTWQLRDTGDALDTAGVALERTGKTVSAFDSLPLVGSGAGAAGDRIRERGAQVTAAADDARTRIAIVSIRPACSSH